MLRGQLTFWINLRLGQLGPESLDVGLADVHQRVATQATLRRWQPGQLKTGVPTLPKVFPEPSLILEYSSAYRRRARHKDIALTTSCLQMDRFGRVFFDLAP